MGKDLTTVAVKRHILKKLKQQALDEDCNVRELVERLVTEYLKERGVSIEEFSAA